MCRGADMGYLLMAAAVLAGNADWNGWMRKPYEKPTLAKRQKLTERTAQIIASGVVLGE